MASPDGAATDQFRDLIDVKVTLVAGVCIVALTLSLEYDAGIEVPFVYCLSPLIPHFAYVLSHGAALSTRTWIALITVVTLGTSDFFVF